MDSENRENDGLDRFSLDQIGMSTGTFGGAKILKFTTDHFHVGAEVIGPERELVPLGLKKVVQKFVNQRLVDSFVVPDGEAVPDLKGMNDAAPREEWSTFGGKPVGPYSLVLVLKLFDRVTMDLFAFVTKSKGGAVGIGALSDKTKIMRRFRGPDVAPVISLRAVDWPVRSLGVILKRPDFKVLRWVALGGGGLPAAEPVKVIEASTVPTQPLAIGTPVEEPTLREEMGGDQIPF
jgi:hypothetical protein